MERISVFDIFKIGVGPSSSHTMGPWRAAQAFVNQLLENNLFDTCSHVEVLLYGSLAKTGKGHGTDIAVQMGLAGEDPVTIDVASLQPKIQAIKEQSLLLLGGKKEIRFQPQEDIKFLFSQTLPFHSNALTFKAFSEGKSLLLEDTYYSIGGGFIVKEGKNSSSQTEVKLRFPIDNGENLQAWCDKQKLSISEVVWNNELSWRSTEEIEKGLLKIWEVMKQCVFRGCYTEGKLPGGLNVTRRAAGMNKKLLGDSHRLFEHADSWIDAVKRSSTQTFDQTLRWISCFALAVNEENAAYGRVVTAPTNGAAGVIPAVMMYHYCFYPHATEKDMIRFMLTAGEIGSIFKKGSTISAAMGGCQAEIGVSSAMAAAGLTELMGGSPQQVIMSAEIAMEHHLGLTCDPIGGLVQIPCIERNSMGAMKAITASQLALVSEPSAAKVSLDAVIKTMWETAQDMNTKYKETSDGGLATNISVNLPEC